MSTEPFETCWHCGYTIDARPRPRCQYCPDECDDEDCEEFGHYTAIVRDEDRDARRLGAVADALPLDDWTPGECSLAEAVAKVVAERDRLRTAAEQTRERMQGRAAEWALHNRSEAAHAYREAARLLDEALRGDS